MKRITMLASGTRGDVQPVIALGKALRSVGYGVRVVAGRGFHDWIEGHGLEAAPSSVDMETVMTSEAGRVWVERGHNLLVQQRLMRRLFDAYGPRMIRDAWEACQDADAVIGSFTSDAYAIAVGERLGLPVLSAPLQPTLIATRDGRAMTSAPLPDRVSPINRWFGHLLIEPFPWRLYGGPVNRFRREIGLQAQTNRQNVAARRAMTVIHGVSRHVMPSPADWPVNFHVSGYWFLDDDPAWEPPAELVEFLADGPPPVGIGFGSMTGGNPEDTRRLVVGAARDSGVRAVLLTGWAPTDSEGPPPGILVLPAAPHSWLFPRMAAVVHHGGAGTTAAGLRAGVPNVLVPHMADQPYWAGRVRSLGVGPGSVPRHRLTREALAAAIREAVTDEPMRRRAADLAGKIGSEDGLGQAVSLIARTVGPP